MIYDDEGRTYDPSEGANKNAVHLWTVLFLMEFVLLLIYPLGLVVLSIVTLSVGVAFTQAESHHRRGYGYALVASGVLAIAVFLCIGIGAITDGQGAP